MDILIKNMEPARILDIFDKAGVRFNENGEAIKFEIFHSDAEPVRHGRWIREGVGSDNSSDGYFKISMAECSECGTCVMGKPNYCPNCGARMDGEERKYEQAYQKEKAQTMD